MTIKKQRPPTQPLNPESRTPTRKLDPLPPPRPVRQPRVNFTTDRRTLLTMTEPARKELAWKWFMRGFRLSGYQFHGEKLQLADSPSVESLMRAEFERDWGEIGSGN